MQKILFSFLLACCVLPAWAQKYDVGAMFGGGINVKAVGKIEISDSTAVFAFDGSPTMTYDVVKKVNGLVYITDGVMTHTLAFVPKKGKMKGFAYDVLINFAFDKRQRNETFMYYAKIVTQ
jgi:hypothetical protein